MVVGLSLLSHETLTFNGAAEKDGSFNIRGGRGSDTLTGGAGRDVIYGNLGADILKGGGGRDGFEYRSSLESTAAAADSILDFEAGDKILLQAIDADGIASNGDTAFTWLGSAPFSGQRGQLRVWEQEPGKWVVEGDINGDGTADLVISVTTAALHPITSADFMF